MDKQVFQISLEMAKKRNSKIVLKDLHRDGTKVSPADMWLFWDINPHPSNKKKKLRQMIKIK